MTEAGTLDVVHMAHSKCSDKKAVVDECDVFFLCWFFFHLKNHSYPQKRYVFCSDP